MNNKRILLIEIYPILIGKKGKEINQPFSFGAIIINSYQPCNLDFKNEKWRRTAGLIPIEYCY